MTVEATLPAVHVLQLVELVSRWGVTADELLEGTALDARALADPALRLPMSTVATIASRAQTLTGEPAIGAYLGLQMRASAHGYLGFAAMTSSTLREALELATTFAPTRTEALSLRLHVDGGLCSLVVEERIALGDARELVILALVLGLQQIAAALLGDPKSSGSDVDFAFPRPATFARVEAIARGRFRFDQPLNQIVFPAAELDRRLVLGDPVAQKLARDQCERELEALGKEHRESLVRRVRALVAKEGSAGEGFRSLDEVASIVGMSTRTLKRRLADEGAAFSTLLEEEQRERAFVLLRVPELSIEQVALRVGYSELANFTRAFRRWTGMTPSAYRRAKLA